ncbi:hypothetical protein JKP88DRAFT_232928 [Tribonema minus]|uniref:CCT domain-containing protein n=1 Tax=Tribonema minus TaxID=303371 RepID=A0A835ZB73_9STRA|nr:hypothetical protein JKP88DRAFT_232928 [Tribonema minus]
MTQLYYDGGSAPKAAATEQAAAIDDLLDLILLSDGVRPEGAPTSSPHFSPSFWSIFSDPDALPAAEDWLLPPPAAPAAPLVAPEPRHVIVVRSPEQQQQHLNKSRYLTEVNSAPLSQRQQPQRPFSAVGGASSAPFKPQPAPTTSFAFLDLIPKVASIPIEGDGPAAHAPTTITPVHHGWAAKRTVTAAAIDLGAGAVKAAPREKRAKVERYLQKRQRRMQQASRPAVYVRRTELANARPRVAGRFISQPSGFVPVTRL